MSHEFSRMELLLGPDTVRSFSQKRVAIFGLGGVGSYVAEGLARCGIGAFDLIDPDMVISTASWLPSTLPSARRKPMSQELGFWTLTRALPYRFPTFFSTKRPSDASLLNVMIMSLTPSTLSPPSFCSSRRHTSAIFPSSAAWAWGISSVRNFSPSQICFRQASAPWPG